MRARRNERQEPAGVGRAVVRILAALVIVLGVFGRIPAATGAQEAADPYAGLQELAGCIEGSERLALVLLVDRSQSLQDTDPRGLRVAGSRLVATQLARITSPERGGLQVRLLVAGFDTDFENGRPWMDLTEATLPHALDDIDRFATADDGLDTDYVNALQGAQERLQEEVSRRPGEPPCEAILWFTDGQLSIEDRLTAASEERGRDRTGEWRFKDYAPEIDLGTEGGGRRAEERARQLLCEDGGVIDQVRAARINLTVAALTTTVAPADIDLLGALATGRRGATTCGTRGTPRSGTLLEADELDEVIAIFDRIANGLAGGNSGGESSNPLCPLVPCELGTRRFPIDGALRRFHVLAQSDADDMAVQITAPGAPPVLLPTTGSGARQAGAVPLTYAWVAPNALTIDADDPGRGGNWVGEWTLTFIDTTGKNPGAVARSSIYVFGDVAAQLVSGPAVRRGMQADLVFEIARQSGTPVPEDGFARSVELAVSITDPQTGEVVDLRVPERSADGRYHVPYDVPEDLSPSSVNLTSRVQVVTSSGIVLAPSVSTRALDVLVPIEYPTVVTRELLLGRIVGTRPSDGHGRATIELRGSDLAAGCAWVDAVDFEVAPREAGRISSRVEDGWTRQGRCLPVPKGKTRHLVVEARPGSTARGTASGTVTVRLTAAGTDQVIDVDLPVRLDLRRPVNPPLVLAILVGLFVVGLALPIGFLYFANWWNARYEDLGALHGASVPVEVTEDGVRRLEAGAGPPDGAVVNYFDFGPVAVPPGRRREFSLEAERLRFRPRLSRSPLRRPFGLVSGPAPCVGSAPPGASGADACVPLALGNAWIFVPEVPSGLEDEGDARPVLRGVLVCFGQKTELGRAAEILSTSVAGDLPSHVRSLAARLRRPLDVPLPDAEAPGWDPADDREAEALGGHRPDRPVGGPASWVDPTVTDWGDDDTLITPTPAPVPRPRRRWGRRREAGGEPDTTRAGTGRRRKVTYADQWPQTARGRRRTPLPPAPPPDGSGSGGDVGDESWSDPWDDPLSGGHDAP